MTWEPLFAVLGVATGVLSFMRALGSSIGIAVFGAVAVASGIEINIAEHSLAATTAALANVSSGFFAPVFFAASVCLILSGTLLGLMPARPLRGRS